MKPTGAFPVALLAAALSFGSAFAADDFIAREEGAIQALGRLNATALLCKDLESVHALKKAMIYGVPKLRDYGETFEEATNAAFLEMSAKPPACPTPAALAAEIEAAVAHMKTVFADYKE